MPTIPIVTLALREEDGSLTINSQTSDGLLLVSILLQAAQTIMNTTREKIGPMPEEVIKGGSAKQIIT